MNKKELSERDICTKFITPNIKKALPKLWEVDLAEKYHQEPVTLKTHPLESEIELSRTHSADLLQAVLKEAFAP